MVVMITAGGTSEPIDRVRSITNTSTGNLALCIHTAWTEYQKARGCDLKIHYIAGPKAVLPKSDAHTLIHKVTDTFSVEKKISGILRGETVDIIIHLMAVSDFYVASVKPLGVMAMEMAKEINRIYEKGGKITGDVLKDYWNTQITVDKVAGKISSGDDLFLHLAKTPKIISEMKRISPKSRLVGFKLLDSVHREELIEVAKKQRKENGCEFVVANDLSEISGNRHVAIFVADEVIRTCETKEAIAKAIVEELMN